MMDSHAYTAFYYTNLCFNNIDVVEFERSLPLKKGIVISNSWSYKYLSGFTTYYPTSQDDVENTIYFNFTTEEVANLPFKPKYFGGNFVNETNIELIAMCLTRVSYINKNITYIPNLLREHIKPLIFQYKNDDIVTTQDDFSNNNKIVGVVFLDNMRTFNLSRLKVSLNELHSIKKSFYLYFICNTFQLYEVFQDLYKEEELIYRLFPEIDPLYVQRINTIPKNLPIKKLVEYIKIRERFSVSLNPFKKKLFDAKISNLELMGLQMDFLGNAIDSETVVI